MENCRNAPHDTGIISHPPEVGTDARRSSLYYVGILLDNRRGEGSADLPTKEQIWEHDAPNFQRHCLGHREPDFYTRFTILKHLIVASPQTGQLLSIDQGAETTNTSGNPRIHFEFDVPLYNIKFYYNVANPDSTTMINRDLFLIMGCSRGSTTMPALLAYNARLRFRD